MIGKVDERGRALLEVHVRSKLHGDNALVTTWIDTAFDGHLVFSSDLIKELELETLVETEAILADGSKVTLDAFICFIEWFGQQLPIQVIANDGRFPLLGTGLLEQRVLHIDYSKNLLTLD